MYNISIGGRGLKNETIVVLDFGGQYNFLITRRVRQEKVYCEILPCSTPAEKIAELNPKGIIFAGGPASVDEPGAPMCDIKVFQLGVPILGICYGIQLMGHMLGGRTGKAPVKEYGETEVSLDNTSMLFDGIEKESTCWMSRTCHVEKLPEGFRTTATTANCPVAAMEDANRKIYGVQFHPEAVHTPKGQDMLRNFLFKICGCKGDWIMADFIGQQVEAIREKVGDRKALLALSGGVDSSVAAVLMHKAIGDRLHCIFVDHGLMRKNEGDEIESVFREKFHLNLVRVNAGNRFLEKLKGVVDPERKRKIIGEEFIRVFEEEAKKIGKVDFLVQGTIYPDVVESGGTNGAAVIKSHHNVGGLPEHVDFQEIIEPLRNLFKDEVRIVGEELGIPKKIVWRQPFPGPGLAIRIIGEVTEEKLAILREADAIFREEVAKAGLTREIWQYFAVLTNMRSVGVMGDSRTYDYAVALRGVTSVDAMTADWARIPHDVLAKVSNRIVNEVSHINRVVYDITSKPPATIEWE